MFISLRIKRQLRYLLSLMCFVVLVSIGSIAVAKEKPIHLDIYVSGTGDYNGRFSYEINRTYYNVSSETQKIYEQVSFPRSFAALEHYQILFVDEGFQIELKERKEPYDIYEIKGELKPSERKYITFGHQAVRKSGSNRDGAFFSNHIPVPISGENITLRNVMVSFDFPAYAKAYENGNVLGISYGNQGNYLELEPTFLPGTLNGVRWNLLNDEIILGEEKGNVSFNDLRSIQLRNSYRVRINNVHNYYVYLALGLSAIGLIYSGIITWKIRKKL